MEVINHMGLISNETTTYSNDLSVLRVDNLSLPVISCTGSTTPTELSLTISSMFCCGTVSAASGIGAAAGSDDWRSTVALITSVLTAGCSLLSSM